MADWRKTRWAAFLVIGCFVLVQLTLPLTRIGADDPTRFGWQMYSSPRPLPDFFIVTSTGEVPVDVSEHTASIRVESDYVAVLPPHLCAVTPDAVRISWDGGGYEC